MYKLLSSFFCFLNSSKDQSSASNTVEKNNSSKEQGYSAPCLLPELSGGLYSATVVLKGLNKKMVPELKSV